jgi:hypothetical protein
MINQDYLTICQECGCVFDYSWAKSKSLGSSAVCFCPSCKHEYELPRKQEYCDHIYIGTEDRVGYHYEECSKCGKLKD